MQHTHTYIDADTGLEVKVYPPQSKSKKRCKKYVPMKERDAQCLERNHKQAMRMNPYDAAVVFGMQRKEAVSAPQSTTGFEAALRRERAKFNRRKSA